MAIHHQPVMLCLTCYVQEYIELKYHAIKDSHQGVCVLRVCVCVGGGGGGGLLLHYGGGFTYKESNILLGHQRKLRDQVYSY